MKMYVGVTDKNWFELLKSEKCDEVNFWTPGARNFKALQPNEMFLFKLHKPDDYIVGGGYFVRSTVLPTYLAWETFGVKNGTHSLAELNNRIAKYRSRNNIADSTPQIGCIILTEPFFLERSEWIPAPENWNYSIVQGKTYTTDEPIGQRMYQEVTNRLSVYYSLLSGKRYSTGVTKHRLGQGAFRVLVTDAYQRRCAVTGERTLPVLQAAHIKPYSQNGEHAVKNGLLLRSDLHTLYDEGYITIDTDYRLDVSKRLHEDYGNGRDYYKYHGQKLLILPERKEERPAKELLEWHNENVFLG